MARLSILLLLVLPVCMSIMDVRSYSLPKASPKPNARDGGSFPADFDQTLLPSVRSGKETQVRREIVRKCPSCCKSGCKKALCANKYICPTEVPSSQIVPKCPSCCKRGCKLTFCGNKDICPTEAPKCPTCCKHGCKHLSCGNNNICPRNLSN